MKNLKQRFTLPEDWGIGREHCVELHEQYRSKALLPGWVGTKEGYAELLKKALKHRARKAPSTEIAALSKALRRLSRVVEQNQAKLRAYEERLQAQELIIQSLTEVPSPVEKGDYEAFMESTAAAEMFPGEYIAFLPGVGVVAHGADSSAVLRAADEHPDSDKIAIGFFERA